MSASLQAIAAMEETRKKPRTWRQRPNQVAPVIFWTSRLRRVEISLRTGEADFRNSQTDVKQNVLHIGNCSSPFFEFLHATSFAMIENFKTQRIKIYRKFEKRLGAFVVNRISGLELFSIKENNPY
jgi:hypothetical protein